MLDCQECAESIVRDESALPQDGSGMASPQRPERSWDAREVCPPGLPSQAGPCCRRVSESSPPGVLVIALKCFSLLWGHRGEDSEILLCEQIFPMAHNSKENLLTDRAWSAIDGTGGEKLPRFN